MSTGEEPRQCGISWLWLLPEKHPFTPYCEAHDIAYDAKKAGIITDSSSYRVDRNLLNSMLAFARKEGSKWLKFQAYLFYAIIRLWGILFWNKAKAKENGK